MIRGRVTQWWALRRRAHRSARHWAAAATFGQLAELTALWLEGELTFHPTGDFGPDPETAGLVPVLVRMNRAGFLTESSQPGAIENGWRQRAAVTGYVADERVLHALVVAARVQHLLITVHHPDALERPTPLLVTTHNDTDFLYFGARTRSATRATYGAACGRDAVDAVNNTFQITLADPAWGRDTVLWPAIAGALSAVCREDQN